MKPESGLFLGIYPIPEVWVFIKPFPCTSLVKLQLCPEIYSYIVLFASFQPLN
jgi:hypothetical protein